MEYEMIVGLTGVNHATGGDECVCDQRNGERRTNAGDLYRCITIFQCQTDSCCLADFLSHYYPVVTTISFRLR